MRPRNRRALAAAAALAWALGAAGAELVCFEVGTVWTGAGETFSPGCVLVRGGRILHAGAPATVSADAVRISFAEGFLMPALTDAHTHLAVRDRADLNEAAVPIYPQFEIADCLAAGVIESSALYEEGVLAAYVSPGPRQLVAGRGAVIDLAAEAVVPGLMTMSLTGAALRDDGEPMSRAGLALLLRDKGADAVAGAPALRIFAAEPKEVEQALAFARELKAKAVLVGCRRLDLLPGLEGAAKAVVVPAPVVTPRELGRLAEAGRKGIRFAFASWSDSVWEVNLRFLAALAHRYGLPREEALRGLTVYAAEACGRSAVLAAGAPAEFVIYGGDPLDLRTPLCAVVAGGAVRYRPEGGVQP
ncbi:MAG TPA: hypothetical protein PKX48_00230 [Planctomycetota bacterium]|jgi:imidazolonepropionase-like amidohydrolase|nr:hypothetical protein [Planctomycetota bacterium]OQC20038.1 MAG: imidazolonepropionase [Planctomycetes bacterium ADurb.Bin069]HNR99548.1 hypothetical protein [Planctomycetota bacterium]HNU27451.1 hypothetical protein [Planctomycetota bacterium]HOE28428.1 hypothetical protein [Planctomycetota bacterium]